MKPHPAVPLLLLGGWACIAWGTTKLFWSSDALTWFIVAIVIVGFTVIALRFALEAHRSAYVQNYLQIWERNFENWDGGKPEERFNLTENEDGSLKVMSLAVKNQPARFTPTYCSPYDSVEAGSHMVITIPGNNLIFAHDQLGEWRPIRATTDTCGQYIGEITNSIHRGKSKWGPDGVIKVSFPTGTYKIQYKIEGQTKKGFEFSREGAFEIRIY